MLYIILQFGLSLRGGRILLVQVATLQTEPLTFPSSMLQEVMLLKSPIPEHPPHGCSESKTLPA